MRVFDVGMAGQLVGAGLLGALYVLFLQAVRLSGSPDALDSINPSASMWLVGHGMMYRVVHRQITRLIP